MFEMIQSRKTATTQVERHDLFTKLIEANDETYLAPGEEALPDRDLLGNIFIFLLAGHETTAHTLTFCFGLLALHPHEQDKLYRNIMSVIPDGRIPPYEEMPKFTQSLAVFYETLRMYPPVPIIPKMAAEDTMLVTANTAGDKVQVPIPRGTKVNISTPGLHYNPKYWSEPEQFKPDRFLGAWPKDAFAPFSVGARACLGRKFFETEGLAILTILLSRYSIDLTDEFKKEHGSKSVLEQEEILLRSRDGLSTTPLKVPLVFRKRK
jgi:cytochrome P450